QVTVCAGPLGPHDCANIHFDQRNQDLRYDRALDGPDMPNEISRFHVRQVAVENDDVGHVRDAHLDCLQAALSLDHHHPGTEDALGDLANDTRVIDEHAALHFPVPTFLPGSHDETARP